MNHFEKFQESDNWLEKAKIVFDFHMGLKRLHRKWTIEATSNYFKASKGYISEAILIASYELKIKDCDTRQEALELIRDSE